MALWEKKIGKTLEKEYILADQLLKNIRGKFVSFSGKTCIYIHIYIYVCMSLYSLNVIFEEAPILLDEILSVCHSVFVKGDETNFEIEPSFGVEASELYPDVKSTTVDEYLNQFV